MHLPAARTVLSLSTPVLDGWAGPDLAARPAFQLLQADARKSATAQRADQWLQIRPGGETALLLGLLTALEGQQELDRLAKRSGVAADVILAVAERLRQGPSLVIADGDPMGEPASRATLQAAAALQFRLGLEAYRELSAPPVPDDWASVAAGSIRLLLIDEPAPGLAVPWSLVEPKLAPGAVVMAMTWNRQSFAKQAAWQVPSPVYLEGLHEAPPRHDMAESGVRLSEGWLKPPSDSVPAADFVAQFCGEPADYAARLKAAEPAPVRVAVAKAARPVQEPEKQAWLAAAMREEPGSMVVTYGWRQASVSPLLGKLWQESELRSAPNSSVRHPESGVLEICATPAYVRDRGKAVRS
jgi:hypothetical protein